MRLYLIFPNKKIKIYTIVDCQNNISLQIYLTWEYYFSNRGVSENTKKYFVDLWYPLTGCHIKNVFKKKGKFVDIGEQPKHPDRQKKRDKCIAVTDYHSE